VKRRTAAGQSDRLRAVWRLAGGVAVAGALWLLTGGLPLSRPLSILTNGGPTVVRLDEGSRGGSVASACDADGVSVRYETVFAAGGYVVTAVRTSDLDSTCAHRTVVVTLTDAGGAVLGRGAATVPFQAGDVRVPVIASPSAASTTGIEITIG
jgi:hypothetical protein